jgi:5-formyltetrahydrofolate cyclo-ligase
MTRRPDGLPVGVAKAAERNDARVRRDSVPPAARAAAAEQIAAHADAAVLAELPRGAVVCLYDAIASEVATRPLAARARARGLALAYPRIVRGQLALALHRATPDALVPGTLGILEPPVDAPAVAPGDCAAVLMPGLAFDRAGARLGWGRGHYDATFAGVSLRRIGIAYESQLVDRLPTDEHDLPVHLIVTEAGVHRPA